MFSCFPTLFSFLVFSFYSINVFLSSPCLLSLVLEFSTVFDCFLNFSLFLQTFFLCVISAFLFSPPLFFLNPHRFVTLLFPNYSQFFFPLSCLPRYVYFSLCFISPFSTFSVCVCFLNFPLWEQVPLVEISLFVTFLVILVRSVFFPFRLCTVCSSPFYSSHFLLLLLPFCSRLLLFLLLPPPSFCLPSSFFTYLLQKMPPLHLCFTFSPFCLHVPPFFSFLFF